MEFRNGFLVEFYVRTEIFVIKFTREPRLLDGAFYEKSTKHKLSTLTKRARVIT